MAVYTIHHILFAFTKIANPHLLLDESHRLIWSTFSTDEQQQLGAFKDREAFTSRITDTNGSQKIDNHDQYSDWKPTKKLYEASDGQSVHLQRTLLEASNQSEFRFVCTHSIIFLVSLATFLLGSLRSLQSVDRTRQHRAFLIRSLGASVIFHALYLYTMNMLSYTELGLSSTLIRILHTFIAILLVGGIQWAHAIINSLGDTLTVTFCIRGGHRTVGVHYQFITQLMIGALSLAFASVSLCEVFITSDSQANNKLAYTNAVLLMGLLALGIEFVCVHLFTTSRPDADTLNRSARVDPKPSSWSLVPSRSRLVIEELNAESHAKAIYSLGDKSHNLTDIMSISTDSIMQTHRGEIARAADDEEFNNSHDLFSIYRGFCRSLQEKLSDTNNEDVELYDRSKFSLYEDFQQRDVQFKQRKEQQPIDMSQVKGVQMSADFPNRKTNWSNLEILLAGELTFLQHIAMLVLVGSIYQANQFCYFSDYVDFILHSSPIHFRQHLLASTRPYLSWVPQASQQAHQSQTSDVLWIELICASLLAQSSARVIGLHYVSSFVLKLGRWTTFSILTLVGLTIPLQFYINYVLIMLEDIGLSCQTRVLLVLLQLIIIQVQIGLIGAAIEFLVNDLALQHAQQVSNYRSSKFAETNAKTVHCTVHGLLSGSFNSLGAACMSSTFLVINLISSGNRVLDPLLALTSVAPALALLVLVGALLVGRIRLMRQTNSDSLG